MNNEEILAELTLIRESIERCELKRKEKIAAMCLQGLISNNSPTWLIDRSPKRLGEMAAKYAEALLEELD